MSAVEKIVAVLPVYNHPAHLQRICQYLVDLSLPIILVDDGSEMSCRAVIDQLAQSLPLTLVRHDQNRGKGAAVQSGMRRAYELGFSHVLQLDSDGQHTISDIPKFIETARHHPKHLILGQPQFDASVPKHRFYARYLTHVWVWINTLSFAIKDTMCGFRIYPLVETMKLLSTQQIGARMDFDIEVVVKLFWAGMPVINIPTRVIYPENGISHFQGIRDNVRISKMHTKLFFGMLIRSPALLWRQWRA